MILSMYILGIAVFRPFMFRAKNQIPDYSFVIQPFTINNYDNAIFRCATGLGPPGANTNTDMGGWYFNGAQISVGSNCGGDHVFAVFEESNRLFPGGISLILCRAFTTTDEGIYSCIMMNSAMMAQTMRIGVYFSRRSESLVGKGEGHRQVQIKLGKATLSNQCIS